jgi:hypothetical protein
VLFSPCWRVYQFCRWRFVIVAQFTGFARHETASPLLVAILPGIAGATAAAAPIPIAVSSALGLVAAEAWAAGA